MSLSVFMTWLSHCVCALYCCADKQRKVARMRWAQGVLATDEDKVSGRIFKKQKREEKQVWRKALRWIPLSQLDWRPNTNPPCLNGTNKTILCWIFTCTVPLPPQRCTNAWSQSHLHPYSTTLRLQWPVRVFPQKFWKEGFFDVIFAANQSHCLSLNHHSVLKDRNHQW